MSLLPVGFGSAADDDYEITDSLRLRSSASAYLDWTPASNGNRQIFTFSAWVKRGKLGAENVIFHAGTASTNRGHLRFNSDDTCEWAYYNGSWVLWLKTTAVFRDPSAWYHIVGRCNTTNGTSNLYINGVDQTSLSQNSKPSGSQSTSFGQTVEHQLGQRGFGDAGYLDGYMTEVNFIDGQALAQTDFGEYDANGTWKPKKYTGTYGTNGFYLNGVGVTDQSGNGNNWTNNNLNLSTSTATTYDQMKDTPSLVDENIANFATLNPLDIYPGRQFAVDGNLKWNDTSGGSWGRSNISVTSGKWYWEVSGFSTTNWMIGVSDGTKSITNYYAYYAGAPTALVYLINGHTFIAGAYASFISAIATTDVVGFGVDADAGSLAVYKNNVLQGTITGLSYGSYCPMVAPPAAGSCVYNFGQRPLAYTPPTGFLKLNTFNLPDSTIEKGSDYFNTVLYTGDSTSNRNIPTGFAGGWTWIKNRNLANSHTLSDVVRGDGKTLFTNATNAEVDYGANGIDFVSDGFDVTHSATNNLFNVSGRTYVAWNWKANGSGVSNTVGTIPSTVSANTTAGVSIVSYTGNATAGATVGHGLSTAPDMLIVKNRSGVYHWIVQHSSLGATKYLTLSTTGAAATSSAPWNNTAPTSTVFSLGTSSLSNRNANNFIAYCFAPVEGYSAFGSYTGNGSTDGPFVYTGFRPAFVITKRTNSTSGWPMHDDKRSPYNVTEATLYANAADAEVNPSTEDVDFLSNGFKMRGTTTARNSSGSSYIYMAFAENPFKNSNAR